ncbi:oxidoreductase [Pilimelia terevasa]|uniref:Oxidoreductase n=1 Tax=Pilimelia terevasa TaxID=53372 RepID=A0A8J3BIR3_9ACTN|nr:SDR family oxidoreductase [Pilimelia terevasa]GGK24122.1 oxidoreductase [Pilimelia terevasa]
MDLGLGGRVYLLTGATRGLGRAAAECLVADGARVVVAGRDAAAADSAAAALGGPEHARGLAADLGDPRTPDRLLEAAVTAFGRVDGALISVGGPAPGAADTVDDQAWRAAFDTVFLGAVRCARTVAARLDRGGAVGLVLSSAARSPVPGLGVSNGLRPGLAGVAKEFADTYGPRGVRVFSLLPHRILTDRNRELFAATSDAARAQAEAEAAIPLGRLGEPAEFGRVAAFLLSPAASYLTGLAVPVDGGAARAW